MKKKQKPDPKLKGASALASIATHCRTCKRMYSVEFHSSPSTNLKNMKKAEVELEKLIKACTHEK